MKGVIVVSSVLCILGVLFFFFPVGTWVTEVFAAVMYGLHTTTYEDMSGQTYIIQERVAVSDISLVFGKNRYILRPQASYNVSVLIAKKARYHDSWADVIPYDAIFVWGEVSGVEYMKRIRFSQHGRGGFWAWQDIQQTSDFMTRHFANTHLIPANEDVREGLDEMKEGIFVKMEGFLVNVERNDGSTWKTSLTRDDHGQSCEVFYVERLAYQNVTYS